LVLSIFGAETPSTALNRAACREFMETLQWLPKNASKVFPHLTLREAAEKARAEQKQNCISASNVNTYLNKFAVVLNWAVEEEILTKNPLRGLRVADPVSRRDKRLPFSDEQLEAIFSAPLYVGCQDDAAGYARPGASKPRGSRFWIPLVGLFTGMRLNEICQLDTADIREIEGVPCIVVTEESLTGSTDKSLKTVTSERIVPVHPFLQANGFVEFARQKHAAGESKLFNDIAPGRDGFRSTAFSKWFILFLNKAKAVREKTSFHSFRHRFRDALREAGVSREIAMALGGWGNGTKVGFDVSDNYGRGYTPEALREQLAKVSYVNIKALTHL
jgi:integrase